MRTYIESLFGLEGKVALLTGAGGFLVGELSRAAGRAGMKVVCCDRMTLYCCDISHFVVVG